MTFTAAERQAIQDRARVAVGRAERVRAAATETVIVSEEVRRTRPVIQRPPDVRIHVAASAATPGQPARRLTCAECGTVITATS